MENYSIIMEEAEGNYSAYSPDIDGCIATGDNPEEARKNFLEALKFHLEGLKEEEISKSGRGGAREGSGRKKQGNSVFYKRCSPEQKVLLEKYWEEIKNN